MVRAQRQDSQQSRFPIPDGESWLMEYEVTFANADSQQPVSAVRRKGQMVFVQHVS